MRENAEAAFLAVSEEAPSNNQDELDELQKEVMAINGNVEAGGSFSKVGTEQFEKDYDKLIKQGD